MSTTSQLDSEHMLIEAMQLLLGEKQTSLSVIRTGILIVHALLRVRHNDTLILHMKRRNGWLMQFTD